MSTITQTFTAAETKRFTKPGQFFKLFRTTAPVNVTLFKGGQVVAQDDDVEAGYASAEPFDSFNIESASAQSVSWFISRNAITYDRSVGEVAVIDGGRSRTIAEIAYISAAGVVGVAAQYSHAQLWNPSAVKRLIVEQLIAQSTANAYLAIGTYGTILASAGATPTSKRIKAAPVATVAQTRVENNAGLLLTNTMSYFKLLANSPITFRFNEPVIIEPGYGLNVAHLNVNTDLFVNFEFYEEEI